MVHSRSVDALAGLTHVVAVRQYQPSHQSRYGLILSMLAFYELGDRRLAASTFARAYLKSCKRMAPPAANAFIDGNGC